MASCEGNIVIVDSYKKHDMQLTEGVGVITTVVSIKPPYTTRFPGPIVPSPTRSRSPTR